MEQYAYRQQQNGIYSSDSHSEDDEEDDDEDVDDYDDEEDDEEDDEDDDDNYQDDEYRSDSNEKEPQFSKTLTVKGSIITVADDLLKNDGKKFLDMMEKLAERKMLKEREVANSDLFDKDEDDEDNDNQGNEDDDDEDDDENDNERVNTHINTKKQFLMNIYRIPEQKNNGWKRVVKCSKYLQQECLNKEFLLLIEKRSHKIDKNVLLKNWKKRTGSVKRENSKSNKIKKRKKIKNGKKNMPFDCSSGTNFKFINKST